MLEFVVFVLLVILLWPFIKAWALLILILAVVYYLVVSANRRP